MADRGRSRLLLPIHPACGAAQPQWPLRATGRRAQGRQARRMDVARRGRGRARRPGGPQGGPLRHPRPLRDRSAPSRRRPGHAHTGVPGRTRQGVRGRLRAGDDDRHPRPRRRTGGFRRPLDVASPRRPARGDAEHDGTPAPDAAGAFGRQGAGRSGPPPRAPRRKGRASVQNHRRPRPGARPGRRRRRFGALFPKRPSGFAVRAAPTCARWPPSSDPGSGPRVT